MNIKVRDQLGNTASDSFTISNIDTTKPTGSISINANATYATGTAVTLTLNGSDAVGVTQMCLSNTTTCSSRETYSTSKARTLTTTDGTKTVYARFKDAAGNVSSQYSDSITLDTTAPTCTNGGDSTTWTKESRTITYGCSDTNGCNPSYA